jgi:ABC-type branched-subunit amino acid transport system ATPase component
MAPVAANPLLSVEGVSKRYGGVSALSEVSFEIVAGTITATIGPNGAGKTTLFDVITGYTQADTGCVLVRGVDTKGRSPESIARLGVVRTFQATRLARRLSILDNLLLAAGGRSESKLERCGLATPSIDRDQAQETLIEVGLRAELDQKAGALSFGEQKLLCLAMCLVGRFDILLLDEPFAGVDGAVVESITALMQRWRVAGKSMLVVEHNIGAIVGISDRVIVLSGGRIFKIAKPSELQNADDVLGEFLRS